MTETSIAREQKPNLLQVCLSTSWGGLEMAAFETARDLSRNGNLVLTICPPGSPLAERLRTESLPTVLQSARKYFDLACLNTIKRTIDANNIKTVILQQLKDIWHVRPALIGRSHVKLTGFAHIFLSVKKRDPIHAWLYGRMDALVCLTDIQKRNYASSLPIKENQLRVIPNGVDLGRYRRDLRSDGTRHSLGAERNDLLIGVVGRLDPMKGQVELVEAAEKMKKAGLDFKIAIIGENTINYHDTKGVLEKMIAEFHLGDRVKLVGFRRDIPEVMASLDILVMPSWAETFGRVLIEAMACGAAVVATTGGGVPDIISDHEDGLLVPPRDSAALAQALGELIKDRALIEKFRERGFEKAKKRYDLKLVQRKIDQVIVGE